MMQLYSGTTCPFSHRCRFVLYEKGMDFQVIDVDLYNKPEDIAVMNPYNRLPISSSTSRTSLTSTSTSASRIRSSCLRTR
jgi:glutaredoxin